MTVRTKSGITITCLSQKPSGLPCSGGGLCLQLLVLEIHGERTRTRNSSFVGGSVTVSESGSNLSCGSPFTQTASSRTRPAGRISGATLPSLGSLALLASPLMSYLGYRRRHLTQVAGMSRSNEKVRIPVTR